MKYISILDLLKVGIGPSSSHTLGPWKAALAYIDVLKKSQHLKNASNIEVHLYGSLALTGKGHGTDIAIIMGLNGYHPESVPLDYVKTIPTKVKEQQNLFLNQEYNLSFSYENDIVFHNDKKLAYHSNGLIFKAFNQKKELLQESTFFSIGGGFVTQGNEVDIEDRTPPIYYSKDAKALLQHCHQQQKSIAEIVLENEKCWHSASEIQNYLDNIIDVMKQCVYNGCHRDGTLPGGLSVIRRAHSINNKLLKEVSYDGLEDWISAIKNSSTNFTTINKWISAFAMAVNEENADFGRIVTAPTNGSAGVIPAVMFYLMCFSDEEITSTQLRNFLIVAAKVGVFFKTNATISAAAGGCQAEIGVSSAMAAAGLTEVLGGTPEQSMAAAEIAMEHHLGLTCDPIGGLVQVPCIERNSMGAIKAILACNLALETDTKHTKVSLDEVIKTMWETANDMHEKYKETSIGGLAINVAIPEC